jgi:F0F1-type ATP synthase membrane subunit b/b'
MNVDEILETIEEMLDKAVQVPFSGKKCLVDVEKLREWIDEIRLNLPSEIKQARNLVNDRKIILNDAKAEADSIIKKAEEKARNLVSQQEITRQAQEKANEIMANAQTKSKELRNTTNDYVDNMLSNLEELLSKDLIEIKKARSALKGK